MSMKEHYQNMFFFTFLRKGIEIIFFQKKKKKIYTAIGMKKTVPVGTVNKTRYWYGWEYLHGYLWVN